jgi:hypothetical protein
MLYVAHPKFSSKNTFQDSYILEEKKKVVSIIHNISLPKKSKFDPTRVILLPSTSKFHGNFDTNIVSENCSCHTTIE